MRFVLLLLVACLTFGCGTRSSSILAPPTPVSDTAPMKGNIVSTVYITEDGITKRIDTWKLPNGQYIRVIYICDFPQNQYGVPAPGHCRENGTDCTPYPGGPPPPAAPAIPNADSDGAVVKGSNGDPILIFKGDPTSDD